MTEQILLMTPRQILAFLTLAEAPVPQSTSFGSMASTGQPTLLLSYNTGADLVTAARLFDAKTEVRPSAGTPGGVAFSFLTMDWRGWMVDGHAVDKRSDDRGAAGELYPEVVNQLGAVERGEQLLDVDQADEDQADDHDLDDEIEDEARCDDCCSSCGACGMFGCDCCPAARADERELEERDLVENDTGQPPVESVKYEREDPETGELLPEGVQGFPVGGAAR